MKNIIFGFAVILVAGTINAKAAWNSYNQRNIFNECVKKTEHKLAQQTCECFVKNVSKTVDYEDLRKRGEHSKLVEYTVDSANKSCGSNFSLNK